MQFVLVVDPRADLNSALSPGDCELMKQLAGPIARAVAGHGLSVFAASARPGYPGPVLQQGLSTIVPDAKFYPAPYLGLSGVGAQDGATSEMEEDTKASIANRRRAIFVAQLEVIRHILQAIGCRALPKILPAAVIVDTEHGRVSSLIG